MKKRLLSLALCLALCLGLLPVGVLATGGDTEMSASDDTTVDATNAAASVTKDSNTTYYTDVQTALDNASGGTVRFLQSLPNQALSVPDDVTIDLGTKMYSNQGEQKLILNGAVTFLSEGSPTFSPAGGNSEPVSYYDTDFSIPITVANNGKMIVPQYYDGAEKENHLNFSSVTVESGGSTQLDSGSYWITAQNGGTVNISNCSKANLTTLNGGKAFISGGNNIALYIDEGDYTVKLIGGSYSSIKIKETDLNNNQFRTVTYADFMALLGENSIFRKSNNSLVSQSDITEDPSYISANRGKFLESVIVTPVPISNVSIAGQTSIEYAETGDKSKLTAEIQSLSTEDNELSYQWYQVEEGKKTAISGATENTYVIPANQALGSYTYQVEVNSDGYVVESAPYTVTITPRVLLAPVADEASRTKVYDGTTDTAFKITGFYGENDYPTIFPLTEGIDFVLTKAYYERPDVSKNQSPNITSELSIMYTVELKNTNYSFSSQENSMVDSGSYGAFISKATVPKATEGTLTIANNRKSTYTIDLKALLPTLEAPKRYGTIIWGTPEVSLNNAYYISGAKINDGVLSLPIQANTVEATGKIGTVKVLVTTRNYNDFTLTVNINAENKITPTGEATLSKTKLIYGEALNTIRLSGVMMDGDTEVKGTFSWQSPNEILNAGQREVGWKFVPADNRYMEVSGSAKIDVAKATPTGAPGYTAITESGKTLADAGLSVNANWPTGKLAWTEVDSEGEVYQMYEEQYGDVEVTANTAYPWMFVPQDEDNYEVLTGTITLWHKSSSGSSSGSVTPGTKTDTVKNPDGSTTKTETKADGSKTETTTASSSGGSTGTTVTKTDAKGNTTTEASAKLSDRDVKEAQEKGEAVTVPVKEIKAAKDANAAAKIKIDVPSNADKTTVEIPVENVTSGTVAVIVHEDGTEELVKDSKPTEGGVQLELSGSTMVKIIDNSKTFDDTKGHWSQDEVNFVAARELFNGVGGNQFGVSQPMTRGMVNTVLARLADVDTTPGQGQAWYEVGTDWAKKNGISDGTNPTAPVTREQLATLLYRYAGSPSVSGTLHAADAASVSDYAEDALLWANQNGIVNGVGSNTIAPKDNAQRAQVAAMLARYLQNQ